MNKRQKTTRTYLIYLIATATAFLICSAADYYLEYMGNIESVELSGSIVDTGWIQMDSRRFVISNVLCGLAVPFSILGLYAMVQQIKEKAPKFAKAFGITMAIGLMIEVSTHCWLCVLPMVYTQVLQIGTQEQAISVVESITNLNIIPFVFGYGLCLMSALMLMIWTASKKGIYSKWMLVCNELVFLIAGVVLHSINDSLFEIAFIGSASRGLAAMFIIAAIYEVKKLKELNQHKEKI